MLEKVEVGVDVVLCGNRIEDEVEAPGVRLHLLCVRGNNHLVRSESQRILPLSRRGGEDHRVGTEGMCEFHPHVTQAPEAHDPDLHARGNPRTLQRGVGRDSGTE
jgi:hypothetical protein